MSRFGTLLGLLPRAATVLRTLRWLRPAQARAQLHHLLVGLPAPERAASRSLRIATGRAHTAYLSPPAHVRLSGRDSAVLAIELLGRPMRLGGRGDAVYWASDAYGPLFAYHLHEHAFLRHPDCGPATRAWLIRDWIARHRSGIGWDPHPICLRLLHWGKLLTTPGALEDDVGLREAMVDSMADQATTLGRGLETRLQANHLLSNRLALVFVGVLFEGEAADDWLATTPDFLAELEAQVHPDGGHEERSPMYHALLLEGVLDLLNLSQESARAPASLVEGLRSVAGRMLGALAVWTHADGALSLFADSALDVASASDRLDEYAARLGVAASAERRAGNRLLAQTGYARLVAGGFDLVASLAAPSPPHQPGHAHADALAFELSVDGERVVSDTGVFEYRPGPLRDRARATASHATVEIDDRDQAELWSAHRVGGRPRVAVLRWDATGELEASCVGWWRGAPEHRRRIRIAPQGVDVEDRVSGACRSVASRLPIAPGWSVERVGDSALLRWRADPSARPGIRIALPDTLEWRVETAPFFPRFHEEVERCVLVGRSDGPFEGTLRIRLA